MNPTLVQRVRRVGRQARRLVRWYGCGWFLAIVGMAALTLGALDYTLRFEDLGIRLICSMLLCLAAAWAVIRFLAVAWSFRCSDLYAAHRIGASIPDWVIA